MVSIKRALGYTIVGGVVAAIIYKILMTPQPTSMISRQPTPSVTGEVAHVPYPSPYPTPTLPPEEDYPYMEGPSQEDSLNLALNYVMSQSPYTEHDCMTPSCTDVDTLRTPYAWNFKFEFTCLYESDLGPAVTVEHTAFVTVINGSVTSFSVTP